MTSPAPGYFELTGHDYATAQNFHRAVFGRLAAVSDARRS